MILLRIAVIVFEDVSSPTCECIGIRLFMAQTPSLIREAVHAHLDPSIRVDAETQAEVVDVLPQRRESIREQCGVPFQCSVEVPLRLGPTAIRDDGMVAQIRQTEIDNRFGIGFDDRLVREARVPDRRLVSYIGAFMRRLCHGGSLHEPVVRVPL